MYRNFFVSFVPSFVHFVVNLTQFKFREPANKEENHPSHATLSIINSPLSITLKAVFLPEFNTP